MVVGKEKENVKVDIKLDDRPTPLEQVKKFCYLGSTNTCKNECESEIKRRIAEQAFHNKKSLLANNHTHRNHEGVEAFFKNTEKEIDLTSYSDMKREAITFYSDMKREAMERTMWLMQGIAFS